MTPLAQAIVVLCVAAITVALIPVLIALRRTATRAETVLQLIEREVRPMASQLSALTDDLRGLSRQARTELERVGAVARSIEDVSVRAARVLTLVGGLTRVGQLAGVATGLKKGLDVFVRRLKDTHR
jgi:uncharacterized protein YoxC